MLGSLVFAGGMPLEDALSTRGIDGAVLGEELRAHRLRGVRTVPGPPAARVRGAAHRARSGARSRRRHDRRGHRGAGSVVDGAHVSGPVEPCRAPRRWRCVTTPATWRPRSRRSRAGSPRELGPPQVATVGRIALHPNLVNVVAGPAVLTVDLRNTDDACSPRPRRGCRRSRRAREAGGRADRRRVRWRASRRCEFDDDVVALVEEVAGAHGRSTLRLPSGAGHDAQMLARVCPTGMVFVPSARRHQPQPGRAHRRRRSRSGRQRAAARPAPAGRGAMTGRYRRAPTPTPRGEP